jgi:hypothetical protein
LTPVDGHLLPVLAIVSEDIADLAEGISRGRQPGLMHRSAASETRLLLPPVTVTTGVVPRRPQVRPFGGLKP